MKNGVSVMGAVMVIMLWMCDDDVVVVWWHG